MFPMKVDSEAEGASVLRAARLINEQIAHFKSVYTTQDDLNIAIMCCLKIATDYIHQSDEATLLEQEAVEGLSALEARIDNVLQES